MIKTYVLRPEKGGYQLKCPAGEDALPKEIYEALRDSVMTANGWCYISFSQEQFALIGARTVRTENRIIPEKMLVLFGREEALWLMERPQSRFYAARKWIEQWMKRKDAAHTFDFWPELQEDDWEETAYISTESVLMQKCICANRENGPTGMQRLYSGTSYDALMSALGALDTGVAVGCRFLVGDAGMTDADWFDIVVGRVTHSGYRFLWTEFDHPGANMICQEKYQRK